MSASTNRKFLLPQGEGQDEGILKSINYLSLTPSPSPLPEGEGIKKEYP